MRGAAYDRSVREQVERIREGLRAAGRRGGKRLKESDVARWEAQQHCALPEAYRVFLTEIGEASYYPYGTMLRLDEWWHHLTREDSRQTSLPWLQRAFAIEQNFASNDAWDAFMVEWENGGRDVPPPWAGTMAVTSDGCGMMSLLIVNGVHVGKICFIDFPKAPIIFPQPDFLSWYEAALEAERVRSFANFLPDPMPW